MEEIKKFDLEGYSYCREEYPVGKGKKGGASGDKVLVFNRTSAPAKGTAAKEVDRGQKVKAGAVPGEGAAKKKAKK